MTMPMKIVDHDRIARKARVIEASGVPASVAVAMECWADYMRQGSVGRGYPKQSTGFVSGGINCFDDLGHEAENHLAISADGTIRGLSEKARNCIYIVWLDMLICYAMTDVDAEAAEAMKYIWRGLRIRGAV
jgi:hypothetical protein